MATAPEESSYRISGEDFDKSRLPPSARIPGTDAFKAAVNAAIVKDYAGIGGHVSIVVTNQVIEVNCRTDPNAPTPMQIVMGKLRQGHSEDAVRLLETLRRHHPDNIVVLTNLGMVL